MAGCVNTISPAVTLYSPRTSPSPTSRSSFSFSGDTIHSLYRLRHASRSPKFQIVAAEKSEPLKIMISGAPASGKEVADYKSLPLGWKRHARYLLTIVNQNSDESSKRKESSRWFDKTIPGWGLSFALTKLHAEDGGFLVNDELKIVAEVHVLEVIGEHVRKDRLSSTLINVPVEYKESTQPLKKIKVDYDSVEPSDLLNETPPVCELMDVNGFQVLPSQVDFVRRVFAKHPDIALQFRPKNPHLRKACMTFLLSLIETLCQSPQKLSNEDLVEADNALTYVKVSGFKVDWLEKKLGEVKEKKEEEQTGETRIQELEEELKDFKQKCFDVEAMLKKEKAKVLCARASLTLDDVI